MNDTSDVNLSPARPVVTDRGALPDAPMAMPAQRLEALPRGRFGWLSLRAIARGA
ncbi:hypothetical protein [Falsigemmobacter faecalis]|uniref:hypothetical protein n=1 Tax=Falsigemmobacter faecalis TaxID=2488730 RepID=UPI0013155E0C|nr:hypothetical protein [Falsigemmobacter faecalis]